jgi:hypothetical protein
MNGNGHEGLDLSAFGRQIADKLEPIYQEDRNAYEELLKPPQPLAVWTPEELKAMQQQAYREINIESDPKRQMLDIAEGMMLEIDEGRQSYKPGLTDEVKVELIEAYSYVQPSEGYRLLKTLERGDPAYVEALVKFARLPSGILDSDFVNDAREGVQNLTPIDTKNRIYAYKLVAKFGKDTESAKIACEAIARSALANFSNQVYNQEILSVAATGYRPALGMVKERILTIGALNDEAAETCAQLMAIEEAMDKGQIEAYCGDEYRWQKYSRQEEGDKAWLQLVSLNSDTIFGHMRNLKQLPPITDNSDRAIETLLKDFDDNKRTFRGNIDSVYIDKRINQNIRAYSETLKAFGPSGLLSMIDHINTSRDYKHLMRTGRERREYLKQFEIEDPDIAFALQETPEKQERYDADIVKKFLMRADKFALIRGLNLSLQT